MTLGPSAEVIQAITQSPNTKCLRVSSVYGTLTFYDAGSIGKQDTMCGPDGFISKSPATPTEVAIPMTIRPTFQVAPQSAMPLPSSGAPPLTVPRAPAAPPAPPRLNP